MPGPNRYDAALQMYVVSTREPDARRLRFLRWLAERGELEHAVFGPSAGPLASLARGPAGDEPRRAA